MPALTRLQRLIGGERRALTSVVGVLLAVAVPTALRIALNPLLGNTIWFATYYPAILAATLMLGWELGLLTLLLSALVADYLFIPPPETLSLQKVDVAAVSVFLLSGGIILVTASLLRLALERLSRSMEIQSELNRELQHRVNNNLAVVQSIAAQTIRSSPDPESFYAAFQGRLVALSRAQAVLSAGDWQSCDFPELPRAALEPFLESGAIHLEGPSCRVPAAACVPLVLALHELATNASKHGALSAPAGQVRLRWRILELKPGEDTLSLEWTESGGPTVRPPSRRGLGSRLLTSQAGLSDVQVAYDVTGLSCTILVPGVSTGSAPAAAVRHLPASTAAAPGA